MKTRKITSIVSIMFFILLAFSVSFQFTNNTIELICLLTGLFGVISTAGANSTLGIFHLIPDSFNSFKFASWIVGYAAMITPNLVYIFSKDLNEKSIT